MHVYIGVMFCIFSDYARLGGWGIFSCPNVLIGIMKWC